MISFAVHTHSSNSPVLGGYRPLHLECYYSRISPGRNNNLRPIIVLTRNVSSWSTINNWIACIPNCGSSDHMPGIIQS